MTAKATSLILTAIAALALFACPLMAEQGEPLVSVVRVELDIATSGGYPAPPAAIREKIEYTIGQVGRKALQGQPLSAAEEIKPDLAPILEKIFNQVLSGYEVSSLDIGIGEESVIRLEI